ncbi:MAG: AgmX/PglI C-terminal domain-containing protein [Deltaproteobacteria bacterium]|nr:AgmX/PglI C-terminal domain-containing protein [Deltaproteobacteria bacterium]
MSAQAKKVILAVAASILALVVARSLSRSTTRPVPSRSGKIAESDLALRTSSETLERSRESHVESATTSDASSRQGRASVTDPGPEPAGPSSTQRTQQKDANERPPVSTSAALEVARPHFALDAPGIKSAMQSAVPEIKECYETWLQSNPGLGGKLIVEFTIAADGDEGRVSGAKVAESELGHVFMEGCIMNAVEDLAFDRPGEEIKVRYPFQLRTLDGGYADGG